MEISLLSARHEHDFHAKVARLQRELLVDSRSAGLVVRAAPAQLGVGQGHETSLLEILIGGGCQAQARMGSSVYRQRILLTLRTFMPLGSESCWRASSFCLDEVLVRKVAAADRDGGRRRRMVEVAMKSRRANCHGFC